MQETVRDAGARLRALMTVIGVVLVMFTGAAVAAKPAAAAPAPAQVSAQDATTVTPDTGRRCYRQSYWHHGHRYSYYKCRWYGGYNHHDNHGDNHHGDNNHHGNDNHHGGNRW
ncbi:hypothetical protein Cs7R123_19520 [Catellatospora sp. TT07R-123]|uniref:hypothetical protein n=1 Tax=Catellatospora sp. TT07R-123 TaxID=2733863 RepID=UPI001B134A0A|nr:hypothetical protein [Catellatospora sp. TT07R-123]GHJ44610.1 hypothetical protein Cs7R123_19520 [Catellatospora sp. TT07R-123]